MNWWIPGFIFWCHEQVIFYPSLHRQVKSTWCTNNLYFYQKATAFNNNFLVKDNLFWSKMKKKVKKPQHFLLPKEINGDQNIRSHYRSLSFLSESEAINLHSGGCDLTFCYWHQRMVWTTNYGHTKAKISKSLRPKFKSQSQIDSWDVDIKAWLNNGNMEKELTLPSNKL